MKVRDRALRIPDNDKRIVQEAVKLLSLNKINPPKSQLWALMEVYNRMVGWEEYPEPAMNCSDCTRFIFRFWNNINDLWKKEELNS